LAVGFAVGAVVAVAVGGAVVAVAVGGAVVAVATSVGVVSKGTKALATLAYEVPLPIRKVVSEIIKQASASIPITMCLNVIRARKRCTRLRSPRRCQEAGSG
jgi:hypothetical protein